MEINYNLMKDLISYNKDKYYHFKNYIPFDYNKEFERKLCARYMKVSRIKERIFYMICHCKHIYFCTFTFDDNYINYCDRSKRDLIKHSLLSFDKDILMILNVDYGKKGEREHYHGIIGTNIDSNLIEHLLFEYPCRNNVQVVSKTNESIKKISKYINKLTNHCIKDSTHNKRVYYNFKGYDKYPSDIKRYYLYLLRSIYR